MEQKIKRAPALALAALASVAAFFLRRHQLATAFDDSGLPVSGAGSGFFTWFTVAVVVLFAVYSLLLRRRKTYKAANSRGMVEFVVSCLAGACLLVAGLWKLADGASGLALVRTAGILLVAFCWIVTALMRRSGKQATAWLFLLPALFFAVELLTDFRGWGSDPVVLDYCYELLALIGAMCGLFQLGGFCFDKGQRRVTVFFCLCGVFFGAAAMADVSGAELLVKAGTVLWLEASLWQLLRSAKKHTAS